MGHRNVAPISLLALALAAPALGAAQGFGAAAPAQSQDRGSQSIPSSYLPPPGKCRVWYDGRSPSQQPAVTDCATARREADRYGGRVIYGDNSRDDERWEEERWDRLDRNRDGYVSRGEWTDDPRLFDRLDENDDSRLTRAEARVWDGDRRDSGEEERWDRLDRNGDGYVSRGEWTEDRSLFDRLDQNDDGRLNRSEARSWEAGNGDRRAEDEEEEYWARLNRNGDGFVSRGEWTGDLRLFDRLDQNRDGQLSRSELGAWDFGRNGDGSYEEVRFRGMDGNRDSRLSPTEWRGSRTDFNGLDHNGDGYISLPEWMRPS